MQITVNSSICDFWPASFCFTAEEQINNSIIVQGEIKHHLENGINLEIDRIFHGFEGRETITIWDGTDFECNGTFSMKANQIGDPGDQIIAILPIIQQKQESWQIIGDYVGNLFWSRFFFVKMQDGQVPNVFDPDFELISIDEFENQLKTCANIFAPEKIEPDQFQYFPNPANEFINIQTDLQGLSGILGLFNSQGQLINRRQFISPKLEISTSHLPNGVYFLRLQLGGKFFSRKILIHHS